jgi:hypothetical protein
VDDLLFVDEMTTDRLTDVIHVDRSSKKWTVFPGGKPGTLPLVIRYGDPAVVLFGDIDPDPATEPFAIDFIPQRRSPVDVATTVVAKAAVDPVVFTRYVPGSLKRAREGDRSFLTVSLNLKRSPGTTPKNRRGEDLRSISSVTTGAKPLQFKRLAALEGVAGDIETLGTIENVPLAEGEEKPEPLRIAFAAASAPARFELPQQGITAVANAVVEQPGTAPASWQVWKGFLSTTAGQGKAALLAAPPAPPSRVHAVSFELVPFYATREEGKVRVAEMDAVARVRLESRAGRGDLRRPRAVHDLLAVRAEKRNHGRCAPDRESRFSGERRTMAAEQGAVHIPHAQRSPALQGRGHGLGLPRQPQSRTDRAPVLESADRVDGAGRTGDAVAGADSALHRSRRRTAPARQGEVSRGGCHPHSCGASVDSAIRRVRAIGRGAEAARVIAVVDG